LEVFYKEVVSYNECILNRECPKLRCIQYWGYLINEIVPYNEGNLNRGILN